MDIITLDDLWCQGSFHHSPYYSGGSQKLLKIEFVQIGPKKVPFTLTHYPDPSIHQNDSIRYDIATSDGRAQARTW